MIPEIDTQGRHLLSDELIELLYRDPTRSEQQHLAACVACRAELDAFRATGDLLSTWHPPALDPGFEQRVWNAIAPQLPVRNLFWRRYVPMAVAAAAAIVLITIAIGFTMKHRESQIAVVGPSEPAQQSEGESDALLRAAVREHVQRAAQLLSQIEEAKPDQAETRVRKSVANGDIDDLIADSRLYRQTAEQEHDSDIAKLLGEVEAVLVDLQHASAGTAPVAIRDIQQRILRSDLEGKLKSAGKIGTSGRKVRGTLL